MSAREIDRGELIRRVREKRLTQPKAAALMGLSVRQVKRLCRLFKDEWALGPGVPQVWTAQQSEAGH